VCADVKAQRTAGWNSLLRAGQPARSIIVVFDGTAAAYLEATPKQQDQSSRSNVVRHRPAAENNTAAIPKQITLERSELHALLQSRGAKDRRAAIDLTASESELVEMSFREGDTLGEATTPASFLLCLRSRHAALSCSILPEAMCNNPFDVLFTTWRQSVRTSRRRRSVSAASARRTRWSQLSCHLPTPFPWLLMISTRKRVLVSKVWKLQAIGPSQTLQRYAWRLFVREISLG
jgi:hypothetical protein